MSDPSRDSGYLRKAALTAAGLAVVFFVLNMLLALGQWDRDVQEFRAGSEAAVDLNSGEERIVYLGANESEPLNFDFYPSDFKCEVISPDGSSSTLDVARGNRLLRLWRPHMAIGSLTSDRDGIYTVSCDGRRTAELLLARPARYTVKWASPTFGLVVLILVAVPVGVGFTIRSAMKRATGRPR